MNSAACPSFLQHRWRLTGGIIDLPDFTPTNVACGEARRIGVAGRDPAIGKEDESKSPFWDSHFSQIRSEFAWSQILDCLTASPFSILVLRSSLAFPDQ